MIGDTYTLGLVIEEWSRNGHRVNVDSILNKVNAGELDMYVRYAEWPDCLPVAKDGIYRYLKTKNIRASLRDFKIKNVSDELRKAIRAKAEIRINRGDLDKPEDNEELCSHMHWMFAHHLDNLEATLGNEEAEKLCTNVQDKIYLKEEYHFSFNPDSAMDVVGEIVRSEQNTIGVIEYYGVLIPTGPLYLSKVIDFNDVYFLMGDVLKESESVFDREEKDKSESLNHKKYFKKTGRDQISLPKLINEWDIKYKGELTREGIEDLHRDGILSLYVEIAKWPFKVWTGVCRYDYESQEFESIDNSDLQYFFIYEGTYTLKKFQLNNGDLNKLDINSYIPSYDVYGNELSYISGQYKEPVYEKISHGELKYRSDKFCQVKDKIASDFNDLIYEELNEIRAEDKKRCDALSDTEHMVHTRKCIEKGFLTPIIPWPDEYKEREMLEPIEEVSKQIELENIANIPDSDIYVLVSDKEKVENFLEGGKDKGGIIHNLANDETDQRKSTNDKRCDFIDETFLAYEEKYPSFDRFAIPATKYDIISHFHSLRPNLFENKRKMIGVDSINNLWKHLKKRKICDNTEGFEHKNNYFQNLMKTY